MYKPFLKVMKNNTSLLLSAIQDAKQLLEQESFFLEKVSIDAEILSLFPAPLQKKKEKVLPKSSLTPPLARKSEAPPPSLKKEQPPQIESLPPANPKKEEKIVLPVEKPTISKKEEFLSLIPLEKPSYQQNSEVRKILEQIAPDIAILDTIPEDSPAKTKKEAFKNKKQPQIVFLVKKPEKELLTFLEQMVSALEVRFATCSLLFLNEISSSQELEKKLPSSLKIAIMIEKEFLRFTSLLPTYKEIPSQEKSYLGDIPIVFIKPLQTYLGNAENKRLLWKFLCQKMSEILL